MLARVTLIKILLCLLRALLLAVAILLTMTVLTIFVQTD
jgi:hypothetical protein